VKDKTKKTKAAPKKVAKKSTKKPAAAKSVSKPKLQKAGSRSVTKPKVTVADRPADWTPDSTTAWAQKRGLKQIVIWGPETVRDKVRTASKRDGVPMSTWILDAIDARLSGAKGIKAVKAAAKKVRASDVPPPPSSVEPHDVTRSVEADVV